jgi:hypothetical protein
LTRVAAAAIAATACVLLVPAEASATLNPTPLTTYTLTVVHGGQGAGRVTSSPAGIDCISTCSHAFPAGTQVTLTATANSDSVFEGWSRSDCLGTAPCTVTLSSDLTVNTAFEMNAGTAPCVVPKLRGKTLAAAKRAIRNHYCRVGKITKVTSSAKNRGHVISQRPKPGKRLKTGSKVALKVGK